MQSLHFVPAMDAAPTASVLLVNYVDDERDMYGEALRVAGFDVRICGDPTCALDEVQTVQPDVVITRINQPGFLMNGIDLARHIKQRDPSIGVIIITARIEPHFRLAADQAGTDAYLLLPLLPDALVDQVRRMLRSPRTRNRLA